MEALIMQNAKVRFEIMVSAVYWRLSEVPAVSRSMSHSLAAPVVSESAVKSALSPHEPIQASEMAAFQRALLGGCSAHRPLKKLPPQP